MSNSFEWHQIVGVIGTCLYIGCYFFTQLGVVKAPGYTYCLLNISAASLVGVSLLYDFNLASALIQVSWILISIFGVAMLVLRRYRIRGPRHRPRRPYALQRVR